jgi:hypothetical protein
MGVEVILGAHFLREPRADRPARSRARCDGGALD